MNVVNILNFLTDFRGCQVGFYARNIPREDCFPWYRTEKVYTPQTSWSVTELSIQSRGLFNNLDNYFIMHKLEWKEERIIIF